MAATYALGVDSVSDTALITAMARALETERPDAHFRDRLARSLAGDRGAELLGRLVGGEQTAASCVVRTCLFDELLLRTIAANDVELVVNLGAGLDARPFRLPLDRALRWVEVDAPSVLAYKAEKLGGRRAFCKRETAPLDVADGPALQTLLDRLGVATRRGLVITEGLLVYLTTEQVATLALALSAQAGFRWWLSDLVSPAALWLMNQALGVTQEGGAGAATLQFAPEDGPGFFRPYGWEVEEHLSCLDAAFRLDRWFLNRSMLTDTMPDRQWVLLQRLFTVVKLGTTR